MRRKLSDDARIYPKDFCPVSINFGPLVSLMSPSRLNRSFPAGQFDMWQTFRMMYNLLHYVFNIMIDGSLKDPEKSLPHDAFKTSQIIKAGNFPLIVDNNSMVEALVEHLVHIVRR